MAFSFGPLGHVCLRVLDLGVLVSQKFNFLNMVMWHIKLKGMSSRPEYFENFYPKIKLVTLGWGQRIKYHQIYSRAWGFAMACHRMCSSFLNGKGPMFDPQIWPRKLDPPPWKTSENYSFL